jgi:septum formation protein
MNPFVSARVQERLLLASASPRRREILENLGFEFEILPADVDESEVPWNDPVESAKLLAEIKGVEVQVKRPRKTVIAADTIVLCEGEVMGKPSENEEAAEMLGKLSGRMHEVVTGLALLAPPNIRMIEAESTKVFFRGLTSREITRYINTREPFDKAGAYAIQGFASAFIDRIEGDYFNVVGLPVARLFNMFHRLESELEARERSRNA